MLNKREIEQALRTRVKNKRDTAISVRLTHDEYAFIKDIADNTHSNVSKVIHTLIQECMK